MCSNRRKLTEVHLDALIYIENLEIKIKTFKSSLSKEQLLELRERNFIYSEKEASRDSKKTLLKRPRK